MSLNIDPSLKAIINNQVTIARKTFAKDDPDTEGLTVRILLMLAGRCLAKMEIADGESVWKASEALAEAKCVTGLLDLPGSGDKSPKMSGSMKIVLAEFVKQARNKSMTSGESQDQMTEDRVLLTLAGSGLVCWLMDPTGEAVWVPTTNGIEQFNELGGKPTGFRMDDTLTEVAGFYHDLAQGQLVGVPTTVTNLSTLYALELDGYAVAYRDLDGCLAWKASKRMRKQFR